jgi:PAS domain S-box-containing protein
MDPNSSNSQVFTSLDQLLCALDQSASQMQTYLCVTRPASLPQYFFEGIGQLSDTLKIMRKQVITLENERHNLQSLAKMGEYINSSLNLNDVLQIVMDTIIGITHAERGFLMLRDDRGDLAIRMARNWEQEAVAEEEFAISTTVVKRVATTGVPILTTNAQEDPRFQSQNSVVVHNLRSILCVPLKVKESTTGVIYADNRIRSGIFTQKDLDLLAAFSNQAAVAIENARLFDSVQTTLAEVTELKNLMDNVFASITSGVITTDAHMQVLLCNRAAENILGQSGPDILGNSLDEVIPTLAEPLKSYFDAAILHDQQATGIETSPIFPQRGQLDLRLNVSPLKDADQNTHGLAIVLEDLTERKQLEAQRTLFQRMVSPAVIELLNPNQVQLGGQRNEISILFADLRGFTSFSEQLEPEELVTILNCYLAAAAEAIMNEGGTVDKFLGDAVMAWFNAPVAQGDHELRAVRAALTIQKVNAQLEKQMPAGKALSFGIGLHVGNAILGLIGTEKRLEYTAIGDTVNTARRIQENAGPGQILITEPFYSRIRDQVIVRPHDPIHAKGKKDPVAVYEVMNLR